MFIHVKVSYHGQGRLLLDFNLRATREPPKVLKANYEELQHSHWKHCAASTPDMRYHLHTLPSTYPRRQRFLLTPPFFKPILGCKWHVGNNLALQIQASKNQCKELLLQKKQKHWASEILGSNTVCGPCWKPKAWQETTSDKWYIETTTLICSDKHGLLQGSCVNFAD